MNQCDLLTLKTNFLPVLLVILAAGCGYEAEDVSESPTEARVAKVELINDSAYDIKLHTTYGCRDSYADEKGDQEHRVKAGESLKKEWNFRCKQDASSDVAFNYKYLNEEKEDQQFIYSFAYQPMIAASLEAGDVIAVKGHTEEITEITLEPLHFSDTFSEEPIAEFADRILVDEKTMSILGFTDADVIYVGFPNHDLNDYVVPKPGYTTEDGMLMQKLELEVQKSSAKQGSFTHPNVIITCDDEGCTSEDQREIRPEDAEPAQ